MEKRGDSDVNSGGKKRILECSKGTENQNPVDWRSYYDQVGQILWG